MPESRSSRKWPLAILAAVAFPALVLHTTCIAVLGPGSWGSGLVETLPEFQAPTPAVEAYRHEFEAPPPSARNGQGLRAGRIPPEIAGSVTWQHAMGKRKLYLAKGPAAPRQRLYVSDDAGQSVREVSLPSGHLVARPQWTAQGIVYVRWNPWAIPPAGKLRRYVASWIDPTLRPEASLYGRSRDSGEWKFLMPGHSLTVSPDGSRAALLRSGALLAGYYSIHVWDTRSSEAPAILSLREYGDSAIGSFRMRWSTDSSALHVQGRTGGFDRRSSRDASSDGIAIDLVCLVANKAVYNLALGS